MWSFSKATAEHTLLGGSGGGAGGAAAGRAGCVFDQPENPVPGGGGVGGGGVVGDAGVDWSSSKWIGGIENHRNCW